MAVVLIPLMLWGMDTVFFPLLFSFIAVVAEFELLRCFGLSKNVLISVPLYIAAGAAPFAARYLEREMFLGGALAVMGLIPVSFSHLRAHEKDSYLGCRLLLEKKKTERPVRLQVTC